MQEATRAGFWLEAAMTTAVPADLAVMTPAASTLTTSALEVDQETEVSAAVQGCTMAKS